MKFDTAKTILTSGGWKFETSQEYPVKTDYWFVRYLGREKHQVKLSASDNKVVCMMFRIL